MMKDTLNNINNLTIPLEDINQIPRLSIPNEQIARIASTNDILIIQAEEVDILDGFDVAMSSIRSRV